MISPDARQYSPLSGGKSTYRSVQFSRASSHVVCNEDGDCWHTQSDYVYLPTFGLTTHEDGWKWKEGEKHTWREHEGKGYWKGNSWTDF